MDLSEFLGPFFEESSEMLQQMESDLLALEAGDTSSLQERIGSIFRVAHSIKGGAGTFGFNEITAYTHEVESLLDAIRAGARAMTPETVRVLLESVDVMRNMLDAARDGVPSDTAAEQASLEKIRRLQAGESIAAASPAVIQGQSTTAIQQASGVKDPPMQGQAHEPLVAGEDEQPVAGQASVQEDAPTAEKTLPPNGDHAPVPQGPGWRILFWPRLDFAIHGSDPLTILRELTKLGAVQVRVLANDLPPLSDLNPRRCYLGWEIVLMGDIPREQVEDIFAWVMDQAELRIEPLPETGASSRTDQVKVQEEPTLETLPEQSIEAARAEPPVGTLLKDMDDSPGQLPLETPGAPEQDYGHGRIEKAAEATPSPTYMTSPSVPAEAAGEKSSSAAVAQARAEATPAADAASGVASRAKATSESVVKEGGSIRVNIDKVDAIIDLVGELVITQSMLGQFSEEVEREGFNLTMLQRLRDGLAQLERNSRELQENVMRIRMLPISMIFNRFPRMVHDLAYRMGKKVELIITGESTEVDKTVLEKLSDPLVHLVRNALDHGLEGPAERRAAGKPETGVLRLHAYHKGGNIVIEISEDGRGIDRDKVLAKARSLGLIGENEALSDEAVIELIFRPGFSTADKISDISGRGVGMDVVKRNIQELGGQLEVKSVKGKGTTFAIRLPLTLSIMDGQLIAVGDQTYILPLMSIVESIRLDLSRLAQVAGRAEVYNLRGEYIPVIRLHEVFAIPPRTENERPLLVVVEGDGQKAGLWVDDLLGQQQVVIKSLETHFMRVEGISGSTILGDGTVALILDVAGIFQLGRQFEQSKGGKA